MRLFGAPRAATLGQVQTLAAPPPHPAASDDYNRDRGGDGKRWAKPNQPPDRDGAPEESEYDLECSTRSSDEPRDAA